MCRAYGLLLLCLIVLLLLSPPRAHALEVVDDTGRTLTLTKPAQRILTLAPHLTELLYAIDAGELIVATVEFSDYPLPAKNIPRIGNFDRLNIEAILAYQPDLILAWQSGNNPWQLETLEKLGLRVYRSEPGTLAALPETLEKLGSLSGRSQAAQVAGGDLRNRIQTLERRYAGRAPVRAFYQVWDPPLYTINGAHIISDVLRLCGIQNVFAKVTQLAPQVSEEAVLAADPQMIIAGQDQDGAFARWRKWPQLQAVAKNNLYRVNPDLMQRHTGRLLDGAKLLCGFAEEVRSKKRGQAH